MTASNSVGDSGFPKQVYPSLGCPFCVGGIYPLIYFYVLLFITNLYIYFFVGLKLWLVMKNKWLVIIAI